MECHVRVYQNFTHPDPSSKDKDPNLNALRVRDLHCVTVEIEHESDTGINPRTLPESRRQFRTACGLETRKALYNLGVLEI